MQRAIAMSIDAAGPPAAPADEDEDEEAAMQRALAMSLDPAPETAPAQHNLLERDGFSARIKELFEAAQAKGQDPNAAAAAALAQAQQEQKEQQAEQAAAAPASKHDLLDRDGFSARVKELFEAAKASGQDANAAAAAALNQAQKEQLAAAAQARSARGGAPSPPKEKPNAASEPATEPSLATQGSESNEQQSFERWEEVEKVAQAQVDAIHALYKSDGVTFVDPSFPPTNRALYLNDESATTWECRACKKRSPLPPRPDEQQLLRLMTDPNAAGRMIRCSHCGTEASMLECALRPTGWERPRALRDDVTFQFSTVPWVVVRGEPRPDDIRQGHVGNCWFVCAMSALAEAGHIEHILVTKEFNHAGVYQVRLCRSGVWHCVVIDDVFPVNGLSCLAYLKAARRSLWPCLIEKAAAKLNGSYEALNGGTFAEAFGLLTGCPVQRLDLRRYKEPQCPPTASAEERTSFARQLEKWKAKKYDTDELYYTLYSYKEAGFVIGCSTFFTKEEEINEARATGIQVPHAYGLLDMKESPLDDGEQLVKLRNPNGHAGWRGEWSRHSSKWTYEAKQALGIDHEDAGVFWMRSADLQTEPKRACSGPPLLACCAPPALPRLASHKGPCSASQPGSWADFQRFFAEVTICRLRTDYVDARQGGWLPSVFGAGQAVMVEVYARTQLELTIHQEQHTNRGESAIATMVDLGVAVMKVGGGGADGADGGGGGGGEALTLVARGERTPSSSVSVDTPLELDGFTSRYLLMPLCFGHVGSPEPRKFVAAALSNQPLSIETVELPPKQLAEAMIAVAVQHGEKQTMLNHPVFGAMLNLYTLDEESGYALVAENPTMVRVPPQLSPRPLAPWPHASHAIPHAALP